MPPRFRLTSQRIEIDAACPLVWEMITSVGRGQLPGSKNTACLVERKSENRLIVEFVTYSPDKVYTTLEEMTLHPPDRIIYRHLTGPLPFVKEEIRLESLGEHRTALLYRGVFGTKSLLGHVLGPLYIRPRFDRLAREHLQEIKQAAENRAARSIKYRRGKDTAEV